MNAAITLSRQPYNICHKAQALATTAKSELAAISRRFTTSDKILILSSTAFSLVLFPKATLLGISLFIWNLFLEKSLEAAKADKEAKRVIGASFNFYYTIFRHYSIPVMTGYTLNFASQYGFIVLANPKVAECFAILTCTLYAAILLNTSDTILGKKGCDDNKNSHINRACLYTMINYSIRCFFRALPHMNFPGYAQFATNYNQALCAFLSHTPFIKGLYTFLNAESITKAFGDFLGSVILESTKFPTLSLSSVLLLGLYTTVTYQLCDGLLKHVRNNYFAGEMNLALSFGHGIMRDLFSSYDKNIVQR
jgi:hypothetical protein